jgi:hypothetical protein
MRPPFGERSQLGQAFEVLFTQLEKSEPPLKLRIVELQDFHVVWLVQLLHSMIAAN